MYDVSQTWKSLVALTEHFFETKAVIAGVEYAENTISGLTIKQQMFGADNPTVGGCLSAEINLELYYDPSIEIPPMAQIIPYVRVSDGETYSEWIPQGVFYVDTREMSANNDGLHVLSIHGYDSTLMLEAVYDHTGMDWPARDVDVVNEIAGFFGMSVDERTWDVMVNSYEITLPVGYSCREVLSYIAAMYAANWVFNYDGELLLIAINGLLPDSNVLVDSEYERIIFGLSEVDGEMVEVGIYV